MQDLTKDLTEDDQGQQPQHDVSESTGSSGSVEQDAGRQEARNEGHAAFEKGDIELMPVVNSRNILPRYFHKSLRLRDIYNIVMQVYNKDLPEAPEGMIWIAHACRYVVFTVHDDVIRHITYLKRLEDKDYIMSMAESDYYRLQPLPFIASSNPLPFLAEIKDLVPIEDVGVVTGDEESIKAISYAAERQIALRFGSQNPEIPSSTSL